jgi:HSP20 family protein
MKKKEKMTNAGAKTKTRTAPVKAMKETPGLTTTPEMGATSPFKMMRRIAEDMENMFDDTFFAPAFPTTPFFENERLWLEEDDFLTGFTPAVEMLERDGRIIVRADLPGMTKDDIKVEFDDHNLIIEGERKQETEEEKEGFYRTERSYGTFYRRLPLPETVDADDAVAMFKNGVLEVSLAAPKLAPNRKRLEINDEVVKTKAATAGGKKT